MNKGKTHSLFSCIIIISLGGGTMKSNGTKTLTKPNLQLRHMTGK